MYTGEAAWTGRKDVGLAVAANLLLAALLVRPAQADWLNPTGAETAPNIAEVRVLEDRVTVALEVAVADLETFAALIPEDWVAGSLRNVPPLAEPRLREARAPPGRAAVGLLAR